MRQEREFVVICCLHTEVEECLHHQLVCRQYGANHCYEDLIRVVDHVIVDILFILWCM